MRKPSGMKRLLNLRHLLKIASLALLVFGASLAARWVDFGEVLNPERVAAYLNATGPFAPVVFTLLMAASVVISPIPSLPLDLAAGAAFGIPWGTTYAVLGAEVGAILSFLIGRALGREALARLFRTDVTFCERCSDRHLAMVVFVSRLVPIFSAVPILRVRPLFFSLDSVPWYRVYRSRGGEAMASEVTIGRLAKAVGVNIQTVRYYERLKLLAPTARRPSGYRLYGAAEVQRLRFIKNAQRLGFTLQEITDLLNLRVSSAARCGDVQRKAQVKLAQVEAKVHDLEALAQALKDLIRACRAGQATDRCPILKSLEEKGGTNDGNRKATR